jgi:hypothetical protein
MAGRARGYGPSPSRACRESRWLATSEASLRHHRAAPSPGARRQRNAGSQAHDATAQTGVAASFDVSPHPGRESRNASPQAGQTGQPRSVALGVEKRVLMRSPRKAHTLLYEGGARSVFTKERTVCARSSRKSAPHALGLHERAHRTQCATLGALRRAPRSRDDTAP